MQKRLELESLHSSDPEQLKKDRKRYRFEHIVKHFSPESPATTYSVQVEPKWKQINKPTSVNKRLDEEFWVWSNTYLKQALEELHANKKLDSSFIKSQELEISSKIEKARQKLLLLQNSFVSKFSNIEGNSIDNSCFEGYDIRISSKQRANGYGTIHYKNGGNNIKKHLSNTLPNVLFYEKEEYVKNDKTSIFLEIAENLFGDVFYINKNKESM